MNRHLFLHQLLQGRPVGGAGPFIHRLEPDEDFHVGHRLRVAAYLRATDAAGGVQDFGEGQQLRFQPGGHAQCGVEAGGGRQGHADVERSFFQFRHELGAEVGHHGEGTGEQQQRRRHHLATVLLGFGQDALVNGFQRPHDRAFTVFHPALEQVGGERRHHDQRHHQRRQHGQHDGDCHGLEQLALDAFQAEQRGEHDNDDHHCKKYRTTDLARGLLDAQCNAMAVVSGVVGVFVTGRHLALHVVVVFGVRAGEVAEYMLHHHHGTVHHHADGDGQPAQRHEVGGYAPVRHGHQRQADGNGHRDQHQQGGAQVDQEQHQHHHDQHECFQQRLRDGVDGLVHQAGLVVEGFQGDAVGQRGLDRRHARFDTVDGGLGVGAQTLEDDTGDDFAERFRLAVFAAPRDAHRALSDFRPELDARHIGNTHRHAVDVLYRDVADVAQAVLAAAHPADAAHHQLFLAAVHVPATSVAVVGLDRFRDVVAAQSVGQQALRIELDLVLAHFTAEGQDFGDAGHRHQQQLHDPVVEAAQRHGVILLWILGAQDVLVDLSQAGGVGADARRADAFRDLLARRLQSFEHQLAREIDIGAFLEHHGDYRQAGLGDRAYFLHVRQCVHDRLDGEGDELFDFLRRQAACFGVDLHLYVGDVRECVQVEPGQYQRAADDAGNQGQHHQQAVFDAQVDQFVEHEPPPSGCGLRNRSWRSRTE